jgi:hypothetical protein
MCEHCIVSCCLSPIRVGHTLGVRLRSLDYVSAPFDDCYGIAGRSGKQYWRWYFGLYAACTLLLMASSSIRGWHTQLAEVEACRGSLSCSPLVVVHSLFATVFAAAHLLRWAISLLARLHVKQSYGITESGVFGTLSIVYLLVSRR